MKKNTKPTRQQKIDAMRCGGRTISFSYGDETIRPTPYFVGISARNSGTGIIWEWGDFSNAGIDRLYRAFLGSDEIRYAAQSQPDQE